ncbi:MAG: DUF1127 domain-containing protein [Alphaproteobacteria bacterium]
MVILQYPSGHNARSNIALRWPVGQSRNSGGARWFAIVAIVGRWIERAHQRRALSKLDAELLADVGLTREQADREVEKPFWR